MINISFGGANIRRPGAFSTVDTSDMVPVSLGDFKTLAIVGLPGTENAVYATQQVIECTVIGTVSQEGAASVTAVASGIGTAARTIAVPVLAADTAEAVATKVAAAINADSVLTELMTATTNAAKVIVTAKVAAANDPTMSITVANGTSVGLTEAVSSTTTRGVKGGVVYFNDPTYAKAAIGASEVLNLMSVMWKTGASLIAYSPVAQTATDADWQAAIDALQSESVDGVLLASTSSSLIAKLQVHCAEMSSVLNRRERRGFAGHAAGVTAVADAKALQLYNDELIMMASPAVYYTDANGGKTLKGSHYLAAAYAGMWASSRPQDPLTYRYVTVFPGLEKIYTGTEIIDLLGAGISPLEYVNKKGYRIVQGITTANGSSKDVTECEVSVSTCKVEMDTAIRGYMEDKYVGKAGEKGIEITIYNDLISLIEAFVKSGLASAYDKDSVTVVKNNTEAGVVFTTRWKGTPTLPINDFLLTTQFTI